MTRRPSPFKQGDVTKAIRAASKGGFQIGRVELAKDGRIVLIADKQLEVAGDEQTRAPRNSWDDV